MSRCAAAAVERGMMPARMHPEVAGRSVVEGVAVVATAAPGREAVVVAAVVAAAAV